MNPLLVGVLVGSGVYLLLVKSLVATTATEVEALARVIQSEAGSHALKERTHIAWAIRNRARGRGKTIWAMVCTPTCGPCCSGRPASSARSPSAANRALAFAVLSQPFAADPTSGANSFVEPALQDELVASGRSGYIYTYAELRERWIRSGQTPLYRLGVWEFWRVPAGH